MKPLGDYFDGILLVFNYKAAIEGEQQLSPAFERPLHVLPGGVYECYQKVALCATSDSMPEVVREGCRGNGARRSQQDS